jgi:phosphopantetheine adenylyltransferase
MADERVAYISSHLVREVAGLGGDVSPLVPKGVLKALKAKLAAGPKQIPPNAE